jgi:hypothetical protein
LQGVRGLEADLAGLGVQVLKLEEHHALLALGLSTQLLHLDVDVRVDLLEEQHVLRVEVGLRGTLNWFLLLRGLRQSIGRSVRGQV